ncbi:MAG TPA: hypothetical protein VGP82_14305 [Ktedonobacterales bacterium]|jgi:hypothetical protein|nr:hypothetical protein [Ktedonobacterales bacterium]
MASLAERAIREPSIQSGSEYKQRVHRLAAAYTTLFVGALVGIGLAIWQAQLYVTLSQRSNVETLTLAFVVIFLAYLAVLSAPGVLGAARILYYALQSRSAPSWEEGEQRKMRALGPAGSSSATVGLDVALERESRPKQPFSIEVADAAGSMGQICVDGVEVSHKPTTKDGSNAMLAFFVEQVNAILGARGVPAEIQIVEWKRINDEEAAQYLNLVRFARNLERQLGAEELWPKRTLIDEDCEELARRLSSICSALRHEAFLPHWEYEGQHQLPLIPEPLGLISLSRSEKRVDPLASMGCAVMIVLGLVLILVLIILFPPWVPGA